MPDPSSQFDDASEVIAAKTRRGNDQLRRRWKAENPHASVLILHGIAEHSGRYEHVGATLAAAGFDAWSFDHQGFGETEGPSGYVESFDTFLDDVEDMMSVARSAGLPTVLLAHSMGGLIGFCYSISGRPAPDVLLLSGPAIGAEVPRWQRLAAPVLGRVAPKTFIKSEFDGGLLATDPDVGEVYRDDPLRVAGATAGLGFVLFQAMDAAQASIGELRVPTFVAHGGDDPIVPPHFTAPIGDLQVATRLELPGLRHEVLNEPNWESTLGSMINFANGALGVRVKSSSPSSEEE